MNEIDLLAKLPEKTLIAERERFAKAGDHRHADLCNFALRRQGYVEGVPSKTLPGMMERRVFLDDDPYHVRPVIKFDGDILPFMAPFMRGGQCGRLDADTLAKARRGGKDLVTVAVGRGERATVVKV